MFPVVNLSDIELSSTYVAAMNRSNMYMSYYSSSLLCESSTSLIFIFTSWHEPTHSTSGFMLMLKQWPRHSYVVGLTTD